MADTKPTPPSATMMRPTMTRRVMLPALSSAVSRRAASGGTRPARRAGSHAASTVTSTPATNVLTNADVLMAKPCVGTSKPVALSSALSNCESRMPIPKPMTEPTTPIAVDSTSSARETCRRLAPMARSSAFSRRRWAAVMENTL